MKTMIPTIINGCNKVWCPYTCFSFSFFFHFKKHSHMCNNTKKPWSCRNRYMHLFIGDTRLRPFTSCWSFADKFSLVHCENCDAQDVSYISLTVQANSIEFLLSFDKIIRVNWWFREYKHPIWVDLIKFED